MAQGTSQNSESLKKDLFKANKKIESLQKELNRLARITELVKDLVIITSEEGEINYISNSVEKVLGYSKEDLSGKKFSEIVHPNDRIAYEVFIKKIKLNRSSSILLRIQDKAIKYNWLEITCSKKKIQASQYYFNLRDLSERMQLQRDLVVSHQRY
ncbi:MAG: PAS domain S-box protein, partial [Bacteroidales bacterium]